MNKFDRPGNVTRLEQDYARWCTEQGVLLREGRLDLLDRENLAEEIESLGRSDKREIENRLQVLLVHLLKWWLQPQGRSASWEASILEQRSRILRVLDDSPSLKNYPGDVLADEYRMARLHAAAETSLDEVEFPAQCPFTIENILDLDYLPDAN